MQEQPAFGAAGLKRGLASADHVVVTSARSRPAARARRDERGGSLVEFALTLPLVMSLTLGLFTGGGAYVQKIAMVDAAREAARYGASLTVPNGGSGMTEWEALVSNRVVELAGGALSAADVCVKLVQPTGGAACGVSDPVGASSESGVRVVKVSAARSANIEFFVFSLRPTLRAALSARYERDTG